MSVKKCRYCKHWADGRCIDEEVRGRRWSDGSLFDDTLYWFTVHVCKVETEENDEGEETLYTGEDVWSGVRGLNAALPCLSLHPSEEAAWNAMLAFLARWRDKAASMGYAPVGGVVECQEEFHEWHAHCDFEFAGRKVRLEGRLHAVNRF